MISNQGTVKSLRKSSGLIIKPFKRKNGLYVQLFKDGKRASYSVPVLVLITFKPEEKRTRRTHHIDGNIENNRIDNLEWLKNFDTSWYQRNKHKLK